MCGLAGEIRFDGRDADLEAVLAMSARLRARGPDAHGAALRGGVALGHRRLKIIDLSEIRSAPASMVPRASSTSAGDGRRMNSSPQ